MDGSTVLCPRYDITHEKGPAVIFQLWTSFGQLMGTSIHHATAHSPSTNGMVGKKNHNLMTALMSRCTVWDQIGKPNCLGSSLGCSHRPRRDYKFPILKWYLGKLSLFPMNYFHHPELPQAMTISPDFVRLLGNTSHA